MTRIAFRRTVGVLALTASLLGTAAHAQMPASPEQSVAPPPPETYTLHILAADAASVGLIAAGVAAVSRASSNEDLGEGLATLGVGGLTFGGPIVHAAHGHWGRSAVSLGLRVVLPILGASMGYSSATCGEDSLLCGLGEMAIGFMVGEAMAIAIDAGVVARWSAFQRPSEGHARREPEEPTNARPRPHARPPAITFAPRIVATPERALIGVGGTFF
jgi:hypothetical protein